MAGRIENLKSWKPGQSGNPAGKPKGAKNLSTLIQEMMSDDEFELLLEHPLHGIEKYTGMPAKAIIHTAMRRAANGDQRWADWLAKYGYGTPNDDDPDEINIHFEVVNRVPKSKEK